MTTTLSHKVTVPILLGVAGLALVLLAWPLVSCACSDTTPKAYVAALKSDLRNLTDWQDSAYLRTSSFAAAVDSSFVPSARVAVEIVEASDSGWAAVASHERLRGRCAVFVGRARPPLTTQVAGVPWCEPAELK